MHTMHLPESSQTIAHPDSSNQTLSGIQRNSSLDTESQDLEDIHHERSLEQHKSVEVSIFPDLGEESALDLHQHAIHVPTRTR